MNEPNTPTQAGVPLVKEHPDFKPAEAKPHDPNAEPVASAVDEQAAPVDPVAVEAASQPWQPKAAITTSQVADVVQRAQAGTKGKTLRYDQPVSHPSMGGDTRIVKIEADQEHGQIATLRNVSTNNSQHRFPLVELFDTEFAEKLAAEMASGGKFGGIPSAVASMVIAALVFFSGITGCATTGTVGAGASQKDKAIAAIEKAEFAAEPITTALVSTSLVLISDPIRRAQVANLIVAASDSIKTIATGQIPNAAELKARVQAYVGDNPDALRIAQVITANYASLYPMFNIADKSPVIFIQKLATGARNGALMFATGPLVPPPG